MKLKLRILRMEDNPRGAKRTRGAEEHAALQQMQWALRESEEKFRRIVETASEWIWSVDCEGNSTYSNPALQKILGYRPEEWKGKNFSLFLHKEDIAKARKCLSQSISQRKGWSGLVLRWRHKDGSHRFLESNGTPIFDPKGKLLGFGGADRDITERKRLEEDLRKGKAQLAKAQALARLGSWEWDLPSGRVTCSHELCALCGLKLKKFWPSRARFMKLIHIEDRARVEAVLCAAIQNHKPFEYECRIIRPDGVQRICHSVGKVILDSQGKAVRMFGTGQDITERRNAEEKLRQQATLLDKAKDAIFVQDVRDRIIYWNKGAENLYGWTSAKVLGKKFIDLFSKKQASELKENYRKLIQRGEWEGEMIESAKSGKEVAVHGRWTLLKDEHGRPKAKLMIHTDISEKKALEAQFFRAQRMESLGTLAGGIAHDLNNILTPILLALPALRSKVSDRQAQHMLQALQASAQRGAEIVKQTMAFAHGLKQRRCLIRVRRVMTEVEALVRATFPRTIEIDVKVSPHVWPLKGEVTEIHQVLMNLCMNARDAMPDGGKLVLAVKNASLDEKFVRGHPKSKPGPHVVFTVFDTGVGIPSHLLEAVFEPFFTTKSIEGSGLGLSSVARIVRAHQGFITVSSEAGQGTQFQVYLPASKTEAMEDEIFDPSGDPPFLGNGERILIVDDEISICKIAKEILENYGYQVITAHDGTEAVALCAQNRQEAKFPRLALIDLIMPYMDGMATIRALKQLDPTIRIVTMSGVAMSGFSARVGFQKNGKKFEENVIVDLQKPFTTEELLSRLHKALHPSVL